MLLASAVLASMTAACASLSTAPTHSAATRTPSQPSTPTASPPAIPWIPNSEDQVTVQAIALTAAELSPFSVHPPIAAVPAAAPSGWTVIADEPLDFAQPSSPACLNVVSPYTAGWYRAYSYDLEPNDAEEGHGVLDVFAQENAAAVTAEQAQVATPAYSECYAGQVGGDIAGTGASVAGPVTEQAESIDAGVPSVMRLYTFPYLYLGETMTNYDSVIWLAYGRYRAILDLWTCCGLPPVSDFTADVQLLGARMRAAPAGSGTTLEATHPSYPTDAPRTRERRANLLVR